jgi:hypothetical protein
MELEKIIGLKVVGIKGFCVDKRRKKKFTPSYILFDDDKTFIELEDQDYFTYHDCDSAAITISVRQNVNMWKRINEDKIAFPDADLDING